jgi:predicted Zn-dependent peptidase
MSTVVFQTIRESKALAYSTFAYYVKPDKKDDPYYTIAYVGSQSDKFNEAVTAMNELLNTLPQNDKNVEAAKSGMKKDIETDRIVQDGIIMDYLMAERMGLKEDSRKYIYNNIDKLNFKDILAFHGKYLANKPYSYAVLANKKKVKMEDMKKYGEVVELSLPELFGY